MKNRVLIYILFAVSFSSINTIYADGLPTFIDVTNRNVITSKIEITVSDTIIPIFTQVLAINKGGFLSALPTTSNNGIVGNWSPEINNINTTTYTFIPNIGQDSSSQTMTIEVNSEPSLDLCVASQAVLYLSKSSYMYMSENDELVIDENGSLIMDSSLNQFSNLWVGNTTTGNTAQYKRWTKSAATRDLISPPVSGEVYASFHTRNQNIIQPGTQGGDFLFGYYDNNNPNGTYYESSASDTYILEAGIGYRAAANANGLGEQLTFQGSVSAGNVSVPISKGTGFFGSANLIGNPYTTYISATELLAEMVSSGSLDNNRTAIYTYNVGGAENSTWKIINNLNSDGVKLSPGQGFMVVSDNDGVTENITFKPSMREIPDNNGFLPPPSQNTNASTSFKLKLTETHTNNTYNTELYFLANNGSRGLDIGYDAGVFSLPNLGIATLLAEETDGTTIQMQCLDSNDLTEDNEDLIIPVYIKAVANTYTISMEDSSLPTNSTIYLEDTLNNSFTLLNDNDYSFNINSNVDNAGRFYLRTTGESVLSLPTNTLENLRIISLVSSKQLLIEGQLTMNSDLILYDISGRKILEHKLKVSTIHNYIDVSNISTGAYIVKVSNKHQFKTSKVVIK